MIFNSQNKSVRILRQRLEALSLDDGSEVTISYQDSGEETYTAGTTKFVFSPSIRTCLMVKSGTELFTHDQNKIASVVEALETKANEERYYGV